MPFDGTDFEEFGGKPQKRRNSFGRFQLKEAGYAVLAFFVSAQVAGFCCGAIDNFPPSAPLDQPSNISMLGSAVALGTFALLMVVYVLLRAHYIVANDLDLDVA